MLKKVEISLEFFEHLTVATNAVLPVVRKLVIGGVPEYRVSSQRMHMTYVYECECVHVCSFESEQVNTIPTGRSELDRRRR